MNQYRSVFMLYLVVWLILVLLPAAYVLFSGGGSEELSGAARIVEKRIGEQFFQEKTESGGVPALGAE